MTDLVDAPAGYTVLRDTLRHGGMSENAIAGILGNVQAESGGDPLAVGDGGTSFGLPQWHGPRAEAMMTWARDNGLNAKEAGTQARYMLKELQDNPQLMTNLNAAESPKAAGMLFQREYEKPKVIDPARGDNAVAAYGWLAKSAPQGAPSAPDAATGQPVQPTSTPTEQVGPVTAVVEATKEGFGSEPLVPQPGGELMQLASKFGPVAEQAARTGGTAWALVSRAIGAVVAGGTEAVAQGAEALGLSETEANQLRRDLPQAADMLMAGGMMTPAALGTKIPTRSEIERSAGQLPESRAAPPEGGMPPPREQPPEGPPSAAAAVRPGETAPQVPGAETTFHTSSQAATYVPSMLPNGPRWLQRLDDLKAPEDVRAIISDAAAMDVPRIEEARRGEITWDESHRAAEGLGMSVDDLLKRQPGHTFNAEELIAANRLRDELAMKVNIAARTMVDDAYSPASSQAFSEAFLNLRIANEAVIGSEAEAGRALQIIRTYKDSGRRADLIKSVVDEAGGLENVRAIGEAIVNMDLGPEAISRLAMKGKRGPVEWLHYIWLNGLLSNPATHVRNVAGNIAAGTIDVLERSFADLTSQRGYPGVAAARLAALPRGLLQGLKMGGRQWLIQDVASNTKYPTSYKPWGYLRAVTPTNLLSAQDLVFRSIAEVSDIAASSLRIAREEGLRGDAMRARARELQLNPTAEMLKSATKAGDYVTFQQQLPAMGRHFSAMVQESRIARLIVPFVKTPINILRFAGGHSPLALVSKEARAILAGKEGAAAQQLGITRIVVGTSIMLAAAMLADSGDITGGGPTGAGERRVWRTANQPYSFKVGGEWLSFAGFDPVATLVGAAADVVQGLKDGSLDEDGAGLHVAKALGYTLKNLAAKSFLSGPISFINMVSDPERYGKQFFLNLATSVIPAGVYATDRYLDPVARDAQHGFVSALMRRIPGLSDRLPPLYDVFGEPIKYSALGPNGYSPVYTKEIQQDPVAQEMLAVKYFPGQIEPKFRTKLGDVDVMKRNDGPYIYSEMQRYSGQLFHYIATRAVTDPRWMLAPPEVRQKALGDMMHDARDAARGQAARYMMENPNE